jgi:RHS repeat-associated protein
MHCSYDSNGNQILNQTASETLRLAYDPLGQLIEAASEQKKIHFSYDPLGRRLSKDVYTPASYGWKKSDHEDYLYDDQNEIGAFTTPQNPKNLRVLGLAVHKDNPVTIGIEVRAKVFAPLLDVQGSIRHLIALDTRAIEESYHFTAFGEELQHRKDTLNPWRFASKRLDPELGLIYFGKRYYDPHLGRWLTTDPAGFIDSANLYQYVFNNPFRYQDPRGENLLGFFCGIGQILAGGALMATGVALEVVTLGGYRACPNDQWLWYGYVSC